MIEIKNLSKSYGKNQVLQNINLSFEKGKVYGIVGENGAGKTTLFKCISGLESYDGQVTSPYSPLKNYLGLLPTNPIFLSRITGWEYLKLLCIARDIKEDDFTDQNVFDLPLDQYVETYSTGMKKKIALMGILLQKNDFYILDEPFNGVDIHSNIIISELITRLKEKKKTVLISSHIFSTLSETCDQIHLLKDGSIYKSVGPEDYQGLNQEMKSFIIGEDIDKLRID